MSKIDDIFPRIETALDMEPEELGVLTLKILKERGGSINRYNFLLGTDPEIVAYSGAKREELLKRLSEAWSWLEHEQFLAYQPMQQGEWQFITRKGERLLQEQDFTVYKQENKLHSEGLDPTIVRKVRPLFVRGDYDTAIFQAFKEVETRVRKKAGLPTSEIGIPLMRKAFHPTTGRLADQTADAGERQAMTDLFAGAIGTYKNPNSHRDVEYTDPYEVADIIHFANQLLRTVDRIC